MKISVALITYNGSKYIKEQIDSILNQELAVNEIIIFDDCSTDNTWEILNEYQRNYPSIISIHQNEKTLGYYINIQKAIQKCNYEIICIADQDDIWLTHKTTFLKQYFNDYPNVVGVCTNGYIIDEHSELIPKYDLWQRMSFPHEMVLKNDIFKEYIYTVENAATGATIAFRKNLLNINNDFPTVPHLIHDRWIVMKLLEKGSFVCINKKLIRYRIHDKQSIGGIEANVEKYLNYNTAILLEKTEMNVFIDARFILNKIENNIQILDGIMQSNQLEDIDTLAILNKKLSEKLNKFEAAANKKFPMLFYMRKLKKFLSKLF
jgi:glycosyltransferase involved in cell wall biosynthesis